MRALELPVAAADGHRWALPACISESPTAALLWLPAQAAKHYLPFAEAVAVAARGVACFVHEWRGARSSTLPPCSRRFSPPDQREAVGAA